MERRKMESGSEIKSAIDELSMLIKLKPGDNHMPTKPFLCISYLIIDVLDKIGPTMAVLRQDIYQNIQRLEKACDSNALNYSNLVEILKKEAEESNAKKITSCSQAFVWLTRSLDFTVALLQRLVSEPGLNMEQAVEDAYYITLKPWHGWISSAAFKVALKLVPDNKTFTSLLSPKDEKCETLNEDIQTLISLLTPLLEENHSIMAQHGLNRFKAT